MDGNRAYDYPDMERPYDEDYYEYSRSGLSEYRPHEYYAQNDWRPRHDRQDSTKYVPEFNYGPRREEEESRNYRRGQLTYGYGNENSQFMRDYDRRMGKSDHNGAGWSYRDEWQRDYRRLSDENDNQYHPRYSRGPRPGAEDFGENRGRYSNGNDNNGRSYIDKQESRGNRGFDNEDSSRSHHRYTDNGGFNRDSGFHLFENERSRTYRPHIRDRR